MRDWVYPRFTFSSDSEFMSCPVVSAAASLVTDCCTRIFAETYHLLTLKNKEADDSLRGDSEGVRSAERFIASVHQASCQCVVIQQFVRAD
ncbi:unnamed protein product [Gadus morhua 'NCC']